MVELNHTFATGKDQDYNWGAILDLDRIIPCVEGGKVLERESDEKAKAEIKVKMGAMSMTFRGTVEVTSRDDAAHTAVLAVRSSSPADTSHPRRPSPLNLDRQNVSASEAHVRLWN